VLHHGHLDCVQENTASQEPLEVRKPKPQRFGSRPLPNQTLILSQALLEKKSHKYATVRHIMGRNYPIPPTSEYCSNQTHQTSPSRQLTQVQTKEDQHQYTSGEQRGEGKHFLETGRDREVCVDRCYAQLYQHTGYLPVTKNSMDGCGQRGMAWLFIAVMDA